MSTRACVIEGQESVDGVMDHPEPAITDAHFTTLTGRRCIMFHHTDNIHSISLSEQFSYRLFEGCKVLKILRDGDWANHDGFSKDPVRAEGLSAVAVTAER